MLHNTHTHTHTINAGGFDALRNGGRGGGGGGFQGFNFKSAHDVFKDFFGDKDPFADFDSFFDDVEVETSGSSALQKSLEEFYKSIKKTLPSDKINYLVKKYEGGKERRLVKKLSKKYGKKFPQQVQKLRTDVESKAGGGGFPGGFKFPKGFGGAFGGAFGGGGGPPGTTFSFSSTTTSRGPDGKMHTSRSETVTRGGRRVTKTLESDGDVTRATMEEQDGDRITRRRGTKKRSSLPSSSGGGGDTRSSEL